MLRMPPGIYRYILNMIWGDIEKQNTRMRKAISPPERLSVTLKYLATGEEIFLS